MKTPMPESLSTVGSCAFMLQVLLALLLVTFVFGSNAHAAAFTYENTTVKAIPDNTCPTYAAVTIPVADNFTVNDLNVGINITHTYHADLSIRLKSPLGTTVALSTGVGGSSDNFDILFDDSNATSITSLSSTHNTASPYYENLFRPASPLSAFNGENVQGNWSLEVCDSANSDTGSVNRVRLDFTGNPVTGTLSGLVYMDSDSDNSFDAGDESGIDSIKVSLYDENFTPNNTADDIWLADTDTAGGGTYSFSGLDTDKTYRILVNTADTSLPAGAAIGTTNPLTLVAFPVGTTDITGKDFGFDPVITDKDFGDAPATYGDASHYIVAGIHLGNYDPDAETASHYSFNARADLFDDGVPSQNAPGAYIPLFPVLQMTDNTYSASFKVTTTGTAGKLYGWIDFDQKRHIRG
ncbi:MAG: proprotein convertase P-domain-containing protein [Thiothrix sp.]